MSEDAAAAARQTRIVQIYAARANAAFSDRLADALQKAGHVIVNGPFDPSTTDAVIVVWSGAAIGSSRLIEAARAPLATHALVPVSIGRIEPPEGFRELTTVDLGGWADDADDPRWIEVLARIEAAALREGVAVSSAPEAMAMSAAAWRALLQERENGPADPAPRAFAPAAGAGRGFSLQAPAVFALALAAAAIIAGFVSLASRLADNPPPTEEIVAAAPESKIEVPPAPVLATVRAVEPAPTPEVPAPLQEGLSPTDAVAAAANKGRDEIAALIAAHDAESGAAEMDDAQAGLPGPARAPGETFTDCGACPELAVVPPGEFVMGAPAAELLSRDSERPVVPVRIETAFALGIKEVTFAEYDRCAAADACPALPDSGWGRGNQPAVNVSWADAEAYVKWLSQTTGASYRLPSEAEWEYAARAGSAAPFPSGVKLGAGDASFDGAIPYGGESGPTRRRPSPVGGFAANAFGLYDMNGNVWEWTADCWSPGHAGRPADGAPRGGGCASRVLKGGAFNTGGWRLRAAHRIGKNAKAREFDNGFRVARDLE